MMRTRMILAVGLLVALAACGDASPTVTAPDAARYDGGWLAGSGNSSGDGGTTAAGDTTTVLRSGWLAGSGN